MTFSGSPVDGPSRTARTAMNAADVSREPPTAALSMSVAIAAVCAASLCSFSAEVFSRCVLSTSTPFAQNNFSDISRGKLSMPFAVSRIALAGGTQDFVQGRTIAPGSNLSSSAAAQPQLSKADAPRENRSVAAA